MRGCIFQFATLFTFFVLISSYSQAAAVQHLYLEDELVIDLSGSCADEWIIQTDPNHIFYFSFLVEDNVDEHLISSSLTIVDVNQTETILFPSDNYPLSPFYSTGNAVSIKFEGSPTLNPLRLKLEKAVSCPFNIGGSTSCGRVVDDLSCYCALFTARNWENTRAYCKSYNMNFLSVDSYEEDLGVFAAFVGLEILWIGASDTASEGSFIWDSTGRKLSPGYQSWAPGHPYSSCGDTSADCAAYNIANAIPDWIDLPCGNVYGGICELQPASSIRSIQPDTVEIDLENELIIDLSGTSNEWIIETEPDHIFYFSFISPNSIDEQQKEALKSSLIISDVDHPDALLFPPNIDDISPFYSSGNAVSIKLTKPSSSNLNEVQIKVQKAVPCPFNLGPSSSCGRVVDDLSCYCALFSGRTWAATKDFCKANGMNLVSIETYEEDLALYAAFGGAESLWIGASDTASEGIFIWDSTGKNMAPGYQGWIAGRPYANCGDPSADCALYTTGSGSSLPKWIDLPCTNTYGGICELQPSNSSTFQFL